MQTTITTGLMDPKTRSVLQAFTGCVLTPVRPGLNPDSVPVPLAEEAASNSYRARLAVDSVAVVLGGRSDGLFAMEFDNEAEFQTFLARNPDSRETLITSHRGRPVVWHRTKVAHSISLPGPGLRVEFSGSRMVLNRIGLDQEDVILNHATPTRMSPESIHWPDRFRGAVDLWLTRLRYGDLFRHTSGGHRVPRSMAWLYLLTRRLRRTAAYENREQQFFRRVAKDQWVALSEAQFVDLLHQEAMANLTHEATAQPLLTEEFLRGLLRWLRVSLADRLPIARAQLRTFARRQLDVEPGSSATTAEIYDRYLCDCQERNVPSLASTTFRRCIGHVLAEAPWFRSRSNSIPRASGHQHGFRGLRLRSALTGTTPDCAVNGTPGMA